MCSHRVAVSLNGTVFGRGGIFEIEFFHCSLPNNLIKLLKKGDTVFSEEEVNSCGGSVAEEFQGDSEVVNQNWIEWTDKEDKILIDFLKSNPALGKSGARGLKNREKLMSKLCEELEYRFSGECFYCR